MSKHPNLEAKMNSSLMRAFARQNKTWGNYMEEKTSEERARTERTKSRRNRRKQGKRNAAKKATTAKNRTV